MSLMTLFSMLALMQPGDRGPVGEELKPTQLWGDRLQDESLRKLAPDNEVVTDAETFAKLWKAWRPNEDVPDVDFRKSLVLVATTDGPNRMFANIRNADGKVTTVYGSTKIGGPGFGYLIAEVPRQGIKTINGKPIDDGKPGGGKPDKPRPEGDAGRDVVRVMIRGKLETGIVAIGGETTGTVIKAGGMTFELAIKDEELRKQAESLNGKRASVVGNLRQQPGVETGPRWIVDVRKLGPATRRRPNRN